METRWSDAAGPAPPADPLPTDPQWAGGTLYIDERERAVHRGPRRAVVGGRGHRRATGWYSFPLAWSVRGWLDRLVGGVGLRRGRRDPTGCTSATRWTSGAWKSRTVRTDHG